MPSSSPTVAPAATPPVPVDDANGLRRGALSSLEVLGQSVANIAPTATPTVVIPLVFLAAGKGAWAAYAFALVAIVLVAIGINQFATRSASPGNLYSFVAQGLGPVVAVVVGWALFIAYVGTASSVTTGFTNYVEVLVQEVAGVPEGLTPVVLVLVLAASILGAWYVAWRDVRLSARLMLGLELVSIGLIVVVILATLLRQGLDLSVLRLGGVDLGGLRLGLVLAVFSFVGFESATSLGTEARRPLRTIPRAVLRSAVFVGVLFIVSAYAEVVGYAGQSSSLATSASPIQDLASFAGLGLLAVPITVGAIISFFACVLASITAGARVLFQLGRNGLVHPALGTAHTANETPHLAVTVSAVVALVPAAVLTLLGNNLFAIYGWIGTTATLSFIVSYVAVSVAAPVYLRRIGELRARHVVVAALAVAFQLVALVGAVYPLPPAPGQWPIVAFAVLLGLGAVLGATRVHRRAARRAGTAVPGGLDAAAGDVA